MSVFVGHETVVLGFSYTEFSATVHSPDFRLLVSGIFLYPKIINRLLSFLYSYIMLSVCSIYFYTYLADCSIMLLYYCMPSVSV